MGFLKNLAAKMTPDYDPILAEAVGPDEKVLAYTSGFPHGYHRASKSRGIDQIAINAVVDGVLNRNAAKHTTGGDGSIARQIPLDGTLTFVVITDKTLGFWNLGMTGREAPEPVLLVPSEAVTQIADTGQKAQGGARVVQIDFADDSAIAYRFTAISPEMEAAMARLSAE